jgi:hypothetical protein
MPGEFTCAYTLSYANPTYAKIVTEAKKEAAAGVDGETRRHYGEKSFLLSHTKCSEDDIQDVVGISGPGNQVERV